MFLIVVVVLLFVLMWFITVGYAFRTQHGTVVFTYDNHQNMYDLLHHVHELFADHGIEYSISAGTALGQARDKSIIPWDDDLDIYVLSKDARKVETLLRHDPALRYNLSGFGYQTRFEDAPDKGYLDLFVLYEQGEKLVYKNHNDYTNEWLFKSEWDLVLDDFGPYKVFTLKKVHDYLDRAYGKDWRTVARTSPGHGNGKSWPAILFGDTEWTKLYSNYFRGKKLYE